MEGNVVDIRMDRHRCADRPAATARTESAICQYSSVGVAIGASWRDIEAIIIRRFQKENLMISRFHAGLMAAVIASATLPVVGSVQVEFLGDAPGDELGTAVAGVGDVDQDGFLDVVVGAPLNDAAGGYAGRCYLFRGPFDAASYSAANAAATFTAEGFGDNLGVAVASAGDVNADGVPDVILGARGNDAAGIQAGRAYLFYGPVEGDFDVTDADVIISGQEYQEVGWSLLGGFDLNNDGFDDIAVGGPQTIGGQAHVFFGPLSGALSTAEADVTITPAAAFDLLGWSLAAADVSGDGTVDLIVGAPAHPIDQTPPGQVFVFFGPLASGTFPANSADVILGGEAPNDRFGISISAGDFDGDALPDLAVGADQLYFDDGAGKCHLFAGPLAPGAYNASTADATIIAADFDDTVSGLFGEAISSLGDVNGDGLDDLLVGDPDATVNNQSRSGQAYLFLGPISGAIDVSQADMLIPGGVDDRMGDSVAGIGDADGDGRPDYMIGAPDEGSSVTDAGSALLVLSGGACPGDLDGDGTVEVDDLLLLLSNWGTDGAGADIAPPNDVVDVSDLLVLLAAWGECG
jgi:hypothetical protein